MSDAETVFLILTIAVFASFAVVLAWATRKAG